jgi:hypothetical protein
VLDGVWSILLKALAWAWTELQNLFKGCWSIIKQLSVKIDFLNTIMFHIITWYCSKVYWLHYIEKKENEMK